MPDMKSLKISEKQEMDGVPVSDRPNYGYGTQIYLNEKQLMSLGMDKPLEAGTEVMIMAKGIVDQSGENIAITADENDDGKSMNMNIQLTDMSIKEGEKKEALEAAQILYGDDT